MRVVFHVIKVLAWGDSVWNDPKSSKISLRNQNGMFVWGPVRETKCRKCIFISWNRTFCFFFFVVHFFFLDCHHQHYHDEDYYRDYHHQLFLEYFIDDALLSIFLAQFFCYFKSFINAMEKFSTIFISVMVIFSSRQVVYISLGFWSLSSPLPY